MKANSKVSASSMSPSPCADDTKTPEDQVKHPVMLSREKSSSHAGDLTDWDLIGSIQAREAYHAEQENLESNALADRSGQTFTLTASRSGQNSTTSQASPHATQPGHDTLNTTSTTLTKNTTTTTTTLTTTMPPPTIAKFKPPSNKAPFTQIQIDEFFSKLPVKAKALVLTHGLTTEEAAAIHAYTKNDYYNNMNGALRAMNKNGRLDVSNPDVLENAGIPNDLARLIAASVSGLKKLPPAQTSDEVFFAAGRNDSVPDAFLEAYATGATVTMEGFYSSTVSDKIVADWWDGKDHAVCIFQRPYGNGRDVTDFSEYAQEKEILFLPGTKFMVLARTEPTATPLGKPDPQNSQAKKIKILMHLQEIDPNAPLPPTINPLTFQSPPTGAQRSPASPSKATPDKSEKNDVEKKRTTLDCFDEVERTTERRSRFVQCCGGRGTTISNDRPIKTKPAQCAGFVFVWWAPRESNTAPTDYESAALTRHELEARDL